jgi:hypothetical protein
VRTHAYQLPSELYRELEPQILEQLKESSREQLLYLVDEADLTIECLSGEWRLLFGALADYYQHVDVDERQARMAVSPDELAEFVDFLREPERQEKWGPVSFGLDELADALPVGMDLVGVVFIEESDDWMWVEHPYEVQMIRPEVYALLEPYMSDLLARGDHQLLARLCSDHAEAAIEFKPQQWQGLLAQASLQVPELVPVIEGTLVGPRDYTAMREALGLLSNPQEQPSLDAWLRVHAETSQDYALYFRDVAKEKG